MSCNFPIHDNRKDLHVTLIDNYVFYHERNITIQAFNSKVVELIKKLKKINSTEVEKQMVIEYSLQIIPLSTMSFENHRDVTECSVNWYNNCWLNYELITAEENQRITDIKNSKEKRDKETKIKYDSHRATTRLNTENKKNRERSRKDWNIDGWIKGSRFCLTYLFILIHNCLYL